MVRLKPDATKGFETASRDFRRPNHVAFCQTGRGLPGCTFPAGGLPDGGRHRACGGTRLRAGDPRRRDRGQTTGKVGQSLDLQAEQSGGLPAGPGGELRQPAQWFLSGIQQHLPGRRIHARRRVPAVLRARRGLERTGAVLDQELQTGRDRRAHPVVHQRPLDGGCPCRLARCDTGRLLRAGHGRRRDPRQHQPAADLRDRSGRSTAEPLVAADRRSLGTTTTSQSRARAVRRRSKPFTTRATHRGCSPIRRSCAPRGRPRSTGGPRPPTRARAATTASR